MAFPLNPVKGNTHTEAGETYYFNGINWTRGWAKIVDNKLIVASMDTPQVQALGHIWLDLDDETVLLSDGSVFTALGATPVVASSYKGYFVGLSQLSGDDPNVNQLIFVKTDAAPLLQYFDDAEDTNVDDFGVVASSGEFSQTAVVTLYGIDTDNPIAVGEVTAFAKAYIDNVLYDGETEVTDATTAKARFYANYSTIIAPVASSVLSTDPDQVFEFYDNYYYPGPFNPIVNSQNGSVVVEEIRFDVSDYADGENGYRINFSSSIFLDIGDTVTIKGSELEGVDGVNDLVLVVTATYPNPSGGSANFEIDASSGVPARTVGAYPDGHISDGSDDQYDDGNCIVTNLNWTGNFYDDEAFYADGGNAIPYGQGDVLSGADSSPYFGAGSEYVTCYQDDVFAMMAFNCAGVTEVRYGGETGSDGDGTKVSQDITSSL
jgi:hypothetical protein